MLIIKFFQVKERESYYDWELQFRTKSTKANRPKAEKKKVNTIGMLKEEFIKILANWKKKNNI